ncbi:amidohydrolase family protein [Pedobacter lusitanus]|uniref:amidohydrolase family protein n=1 Tax=Pedobacter lusitanus TaxID=1503925 RepID=UPI0009E54B56|nr:amidohydrolase family protein [Pedobacter lusitanus]
MVKKIIDTHIHIWDLQQARYSWLENDQSLLNRNYCLDELTEIKGTVHITHGLLVQAANNFEDTDWMLLNVEKYDWITGVVGWVPLTDPVATTIALQEKYLRNPYFVGVRHLIHTEPDPYWLLQETVIRSLKILAAHQLTYDVVGIKAAHLMAAIIVSVKVPELKIVLDHLNQPPIATKERFGIWGELMKEAAKNPNLYVKISGLSSTYGSSVCWTEQDLKPYIIYILELFGPDRCFCGGDWPVCLLNTTYEKNWQIYQQILTDILTPEELEKVFWQNAEKFYLSRSSQTQHIDPHLLINPEI